MIGRSTPKALTRDAAASIDQALLTLRRDAAPLLALWLLAWAPQAAAAWGLIDAVTARDEPRVGPMAALFVAAMPWRWAVTGLYQRRVMRRRGGAVRGGVAPLLRVVRTRILAAAAAQLTAVLVLPPLWLLYAAAAAGPRAWDRDEPDRAAGLGPSVAAAFAHTRPLARHAALSSLMLLVFALSVTLAFLIGVYLLQALLNVQLATEVAVWSTPVCLMTLGLLTWAAGDLLLNLSVVPLRERLEEKRSGGDLRRRLEALAVADDAAPLGRAA